ncbi:hypothetical protein GGS20DRAFT_582206 [Poronia punctata]|nr:hypothetical protein GGS20DRAFT_582206 [Poronia punctata]
MPAFNNITDMSVNSGKAWQIATVIVGSELEASTFQVHIQRLGPLAQKLGIQPGNEVRLHDEEADVFNLAMNWAYNSSLPRVRDLDEFLASSEPPPPFPEKRPNVEDFVAWPDPGTTDSLYTVVAHPEYSNFSIEELRLHFTQETPEELDPHFTQETPEKLPLHFTPETPVYEAPGQEPSPEVETAEGTQNLTAKAPSICQSPVETLTPDILSIPSRIPDVEAIRGETLQTALLKLLIFAERWDWEDLFNDAMEAFRYGEEQLGRSYVPTSLIFLAFTKCKAPSQVQNFIGDHAISLGTTNKLMAKYQELVLCAPLFFQFMLARMDAPDTVSGAGSHAIGKKANPSKEDNYSADYY